MPSDIFGKCLGLAVFKINGSPNNRQLIQVETCSLYKLTSLLLNALVMGSALLLNTVVAPFTAENMFYWYVAVYDLHCDLALQCVMILRIHYYRETLTKVCYKMLKLDNDLVRHLGCVFSNNYIRIYSVIWIASHCILIIYMHVAFEGVVSHQSVKYYKFSNAIYCISNFYKIYINVTFQTWIISFKVRIEVINSYLRGNSDTTKRTINFLSEVYLEIHQIIETVNNIYSVLILMSLGIDFFVITFQLYDFILLGIKKAFTLEKTLLPLFIILAFGSNTLSIIFGISLLKQQVCN